MLNYISYGKGKNIIFLHGWGGSTDSFKGLADALSSEYRVTLVDFYGFGKTPHPDKALTLDDYVEGVADVMRKENMAEAVLVGHSFGGRVAVRFTRKYPGHCLKLVLIDAAGLRPRFSFKKTFRVLAHKFRKACGLEGLKGSEDYAALSGAMKGTFLNVIRDHTDKDLRYISSGALVLWGKRDRDTPPYMAKRFRKRIKGSISIIFPGAGHYSYLDAFYETLFAIKAYIGADGR